MKEANQTNLNTYLNHFLKDQRHAHTIKQKNSRRSNTNTNVIQAINDYARFKLVINFKNKPNKWTWIPSIDLYKTNDNKYYIDEWLGYDKLINRIKTKYYNKFTMCYIVLCDDQQPLFSNNNYNFCVYANYKNVERDKFKGKKLYKVPFKQSNNNFIVNLESFYITNNIGTYINKT